jgi:PAS domain S-box-containing protein
LVERQEDEEAAAARARAATLVYAAVARERRSGLDGPVERQFFRALATLDAKGVLWAADPSLEAVLGRPVAELVGQDFAQLLEPRARPRFRRLVERSRTDDRVSGVFPLLRVNGGTAPVNLVLSRAELDDREAFLCHFSILSNTEAARQIVGRVATAIFPEPGTTIRADRLVSEAAEILDLRLLAVAKPELAAGPIRIDIAAGPAVLYLDGVAAAPSPTPWEKVYYLGSSLEIPDFEDDASSAAAVLRSLDLRAFVGFPLRSPAGTTLGVLLAFAGTARPFLEYETESLRILAEFLATDLDRSRAETDLARRATELATLLEAVHEMGVLRDPDAMLRNIVAQASRLVPSAASACLFKELDGYLVPAFVQGPLDTELVKKITIPIGVTAVGRAFASRRGVLLTTLEEVEANLDLPTASFEAVRQALDGRGLPKGVLAVPLLAGEKTLGVLCLADYDSPRALDVNDLERTERFASLASAAIVQAQLFEAVRLRSILVDAVREGVLAATPDGTVTFSNDGAASMFGWNHAAGARHRVDNLFHPADAATLRAGIEAAKRSGHWIGSLQGLRAGGGTFDASVAISTVRDPTVHDPPDLVIIVSDVTERRRLEAHALHTQTLDSIGKLAAGIAHDFNNLVSSILGFTSLLRARLPEGSPHVEDLDGIEQVADQATALAKQLLVLGRTSPGVREVADLNYVVSSLSDVLRRGIDTTIEIRLHLSSKPCLIVGDETALRQAILNLATNARDAMPEGGSLVFATEYIENGVDGAVDGGAVDGGAVDGGAVHGGADHSGAMVTLTVSDTGQGMEPEVLRRLYEPFFTTKPVGKGTGLGTAIVFATVRAHGGTIECQSEPNRGTQFTLTFAAASELPAALPASSMRTAPVRGSGTVLHVEDDPTLRKVTGDLVASLGYEVISVPGGREALEVARARGSSIDVVLLDLTMPGMSGAEVFHALRAINASLRVLLTTGYAAGGATEALLDKGALGVLQKPYRATDLARALARATSTPREEVAREIV